MSFHAEDYRGQPENIRQGRRFKRWESYGFTTIEPLKFLHGRKWDDIALAFVHALRPTQLRVVTDGVQCDAESWRVTVWVTKDGIKIRRIEQEVQVGLPDGIKNGGELSRAVGQ